MCVFDIKKQVEAELVVVGFHYKLLATNFWADKFIGGPKCTRLVLVKPTAEGVFYKALSCTHAT